MSNFKTRVDSISTLSLHTNKLGLVRSLLAFGTFSTLIFNNIDILFDPSGKQVSVNNKSWELAYTLFGLLGEQNLVAAKVISLLVLSLVILGFYPRLTCIPHWFITWSYFNSKSIVDGGDQISTCLTLLLIPICLSDGRKNHWIKSTWTSPTIKQRYLNILNYAVYVLIRMQVSLLYLEAAVGKFKVEEWSNGTAVYYWLTHTWFGAPGYLKPFVDLLIENPVGITLITWGSIAFELLLFTGLFMTARQRKNLLLAGIIFHFSFVILFGLFSFYFAMLAALILYLSKINKDFKINTFKFNRLKWKPV